MPTRITDPVFERLVEFEEALWKGQAQPKFAPAPVGLVVEPPSFDGFPPPDDAQRGAYRAIRDVGPSLWHAALEAIFRHYRDVADNYRKGLAPAKIAKLVPEVVAPAGIERLLSKPSIYVPAQRRKSGRVVMLDWDCTWDSEQGIRVMCRNEKVDQVLGQGDGWK